MKRNWWKIVLFNISRFCSFFFTISLVVTVAVTFFLDGMVLDEALIRENAPETLGLVVVLTLDRKSVV